MHCIYINADRQTSRRVFIEKNFKAHADPAWSLHRIPAVEADDLPLRYWGGSLRNTKKACFASHEGALELAVKLPGDVVIMEDDARLGHRSAEIIRHALGAARKAPWDLLFTDIRLIDPQDVQRLFSMSHNRDVWLEDLRTLPFSDATAYVVSESAKQRLLNYLKTLPRFNTPYHGVLRDLIKQEMLFAKVLMPFATALSADGDICPHGAPAISAAE